MKTSALITVKVPTPSGASRCGKIFLHSTGELPKDSIVWRDYLYRIIDFFCCEEYKYESGRGAVWDVKFKGEYTDQNLIEDLYNPIIEVDTLEDFKLILPKFRVYDMQEIPSEDIKITYHIPAIPGIKIEGYSTWNDFEGCEVISEIKGLSPKLDTIADYMTIETQLPCHSCSNGKIYFSLPKFWSVSIHTVTIEGESFYHIIQKKGIIPNYCKVEL